MNTPRDEAVIFSDLEEICSRQGYAHVIAFFCFRDNTASISGELTPEIIIEQQRPDSLIRSEISILVGLLVKKEIDLTLPLTDNLQNMINQTEVLLSELHHCISWPMLSHRQINITEQSIDPFSLGSVLREPIFYGGESAYDFQYIDFARDKYISDNTWLIANKGFAIEHAQEVIRNIIDLHQTKFLSHFEDLRNMNPDDGTMLPTFIFTLEELTERVDLDKTIIKKVLLAFSLAPQGINEEFTTLSDFNITNACPLISLSDEKYLLFQHYSLVESLYESPFYWMNNDKQYSVEASKNRGDFVENFAAKTLRPLFGEKRVFMNLDIYDPLRPNKGDRCEIDVLVVFGNRAIILQAKSKRLTIGARKGSDNLIKKDFGASIQDAYDQGFLCAKLLSDENNVLVDANSNKVEVTRKFSEIYIFCIIPDHYPALNFQSRQFLKWEQTNIIKPPFVMDVFNLDVMAEMLHSPLLFLSYANRRTKYIDQISAHHEITILSYFMKHNPWLKEKEFITLHDSISADIDAAMMVRRLGEPGKEIPDGLVAHLLTGYLGKILKSIAKSENPVAIDFGFLLLTLGQNAIEIIEDGLKKILKKSHRDSCSSDLSMPIGNMETGFTIHANNRPQDEAIHLLRRHCEIRKYTEKAGSWYGACLHPNNGVLRAVIKCEAQWKQSNKMDEFVKNNFLNKKNKRVQIKKNKVGVNAPCPCGSGRKFKKCCMKL